MNETEIVLSALKKVKKKLTEIEIQDSTDLDRESIADALHGLLLRNLVRCDSFDPSKRGGQAGVRRWGGSPFTPLWEAVQDDLNNS